MNVLGGLSGRIASASFSLVLGAVSCSEAQQPPAPAAEAGFESRAEGGTTHALPDAGLLDRVERALQADPCVGSMDRWFRRYAYRLDSLQSAADTSTLWFTLHEAGAFEFRPGRVALSPYEFAQIDDRAYLIVTGVYKVPTGELVIETCGPNME